MSIRLQKIATRFYLPITLQLGYLSQTKNLGDLIGDKFTNLIQHFDGQVMHVYRLVDDMERLHHAMIAYARKPMFCERVDAYEENVQKAAKHLASSASFQECIEDFLDIYAGLVTPFFISTFWMDDLSSEEQTALLSVFSRYRTAADPYVAAFEQKITTSLEAKNLPLLTSLEMYKTEAYESWIENGFVLSDGMVRKQEWSAFLHERDYEVVEEDQISADGRQHVRGQVAQSGQMKGRARIVSSPKMLADFQPHEILIAPMTSPSYLPAMQKAAAIITDEGGLTCHAAIVARELKKPCIIGTKIATRLFKDGDMLEVDAEQGIVRKCV